MNIMKQACIYLNEDFFIFRFKKMELEEDKIRKLKKNFIDWIYLTI